MTRVLYEVAAEIIDETVESGWVRWMVEEHLEDVVRVGAASGRLVQLDVAAGSSRQYLAQYEFDSRAALDRYLAEEAPRLRADGVARFSAEQVRLTRRTGQILGSEGPARTGRPPDGSRR